MKPASTTSPFSDMECNDGWIHWQKSQPVLLLQEEKHTERRYVEKPAYEQTMDKVVPTFQVQTIKRPQYNAVMERFSRANKQTGAFASWIN